MSARVGVDKWLFFTTLLLVVVGLAMVFSASAVVAQVKYHSEFADEVLSIKTYYERKYLKHNKNINYLKFSFE